MKDLSLTIDLPTELERCLEAEAKRQGLTTNAYAQISVEEKSESEYHGASFALTRIVAKNLPIRDRSREELWLKKRRDDCAGQCVALDGEKLIASAGDLKTAAKAAREFGIPDLLMLRVGPGDGLALAEF